MSSNIITKTLKIDGMTCVSCENRIERKLQSTKGIESAKASYSTGTATIYFDPSVIGIEEVIATIEQLNYMVVKSVVKQGQKTDVTKILGVGLIIFAIYMIINRFGGVDIFNAFPQAEEGMGYGMLFIIGLLTSIHCVAMCGGINLSQCVPKNSSAVNDTSKLLALTPSILYNSGRVISYTIIGGIVGAIGSVISFSGAAKGIVQLIAGVFMIIMGLNMLNIFPSLRKFNLRMPKFFARKINEQKNSKGPLYVGLLNGLMPCGPLQTMQLYALSTGNPFKGALAMLLFSLGTVPLMFGLGALSSLLNKKFTSKMMTASAMLVVVLGVFMFSSGASLSGLTFPSLNVEAKTGSMAKIENGVQAVTTTLSSGKYDPITVQKGIPVKWTIKAEKSNINGCNNEIVIPKFNKEKKLEPGDNIIEFTPTESGTFAYSCWIGMIRSKITIVDDINNITANGSNGKSSYRIPTDEIAIAKIKDGEQTVSIDMVEDRFTPSIVVVQKNIETVWNINGVNINDNNKTLVFPEYYAQIDMKAGENPIYFIPDGDFDFSTASNTFYGYVKVVDDINKMDVEAIKNEINKFIPTIQEFVDNSGLPSCH